VLLYWHVGNRIRRDLLRWKRAEYGERVVVTLSERLTAEYGRGFGAANLSHMIRFAEVYPDPNILYALSRELGWTHFRRVLYLSDPLQRDFYLSMCRRERWSTRTLEQRIGGMLYERTALSRRPAALARTELARLRDSDRTSPDLLFRDPYVLD